jgi:hypothetical protein
MGEAAVEARRVSSVSHPQSEREVTVSASGGLRRRGTWRRRGRRRRRPYDSAGVLHLLDLLVLVTLDPSASLLVAAADRGAPPPQVLSLLLSPPPLLTTQRAKGEGEKQPGEGHRGEEMAGGRRRCGGLVAAEEPCDCEM